MTEQHIELYKKYRPRKFSGLLGQEKVASSLVSAVRANKIPTAYLFSGERGCGKTSAALLLAKSLNCENVNEKHDPCGKCDTCLNIDNGSQIGVNYISMANKGAVDDVREIVQQARLRQPLKKQVWILDEVHNLSKAAFDALLIPLEEKNMPSLFILCTTEIDKVPQTIRSRVQMRKFTLVDRETLEKYLRLLAKKEGLEASDEQISDAVRLGRGSVRDTLSSFETVLDSGADYRSYVGELAVAVSSHDLGTALKVIAEAAHVGEDCRDLGEELFAEMRNYMLLSANVDSSLIGSISAPDPKAALKGFHSVPTLSSLMDTLGEGLTQMSSGKDSRIFLEIAVIRMVRKLKAAGARNK